MMDILIALEKKLTALIEFFIKWAFILIAILIFGVAFLRFTVRASILWAPELALILFIYCSSLGASILIVNRKHIRIGYFADKLPRTIGRVVDVIVHILIAVLNVVFVHYSISWIETSGYFVSSFTGWPAYISQTAVPIGCSLVVLYSLYTCLLIIFRPEEYYTHLAEDTSTS